MPESSQETMYQVETTDGALIIYFEHEMKKMIDEGTDYRWQGLQALLEEDFNPLTLEGASGKIFKVWKVR